MSAENRHGRISGLSKIAIVAGLGAAALSGCASPDSGTPTQKPEPSIAPTASINLVKGPNGFGEEGNKVVPILLVVAGGLTFLSFVAIAADA
jgi:hypothetical protein